MNRSRIKQSGTRLALFLAMVIFIGPSAMAEPDWIWAGDRKAAARVVLRHSFQMDGEAKSARLRMVADFAFAELSINGKPAGAAEGYGPVIGLDVSGFLLPGRNELRLAGRSFAGSPALAVHLELVDAEGRKRTISSSPRWRTDADGLKVESYGNLDLEKWWSLRPPAIDESDDYTQWKRASNAKAGTNSAEIELLPGYRVELLRSAGKDEGSWVSLAFDSEGRLTVAREDKGLIRYAFSADRKAISSSELIDGELRECRGLLYAHGSLYVNANNTKGLYRLRDTDGDGTLDEKKLLHSSPGGVGHGRNALALGPEGDIYAIHGDAVDLPGGIADRTSPLRQQGLPSQPREGHVLRISPDGSRKELFCGGMRNPFGIAFNTDGEAFTYDADAEFDMGSPWYRPTRVMHLSSGADFGWRAVTGTWPPYFPDHPDNTQPALDIGKGSPTGVRFGTGSHFPPEYRKALYILDWAYGRILAVHLAPRGSSYSGAAEVFLRGQPLNLTDLVFGPDGAMYFTTGGRKTQSALYRVSYTGPEIKAREKTRQEKEREALAGEHRKRRREVEAHHGTGKVYDGPLSSPSDDARIAQAVRIALEHAGELPATKARLRKANAAGAAVELLAAEVKIAAPGRLPELVQEWLAENRDWKSRPLSEKLGFVDLFRRVLARGQLPVESRELISSAFQAYFPSASGELNRALAALLVELDPAVSVQKTAGLLAESTVQAERLHYLYHLRGARLGWTPASRRAFFGSFSSPGSFLGGRGMPGFLNNLQRDARATLSVAEKKDLVDLLEKPASPPPLPDLSGRQLVKEWKLADLEAGLTFEASTLDRANGRKVFSRALCSRCHRHGREGRLVGPELTHVTRRFSRRDLLAEILDPSRSIAENYEAFVLELKDGRVLSGQVVPNLDYRDPHLQLGTDPLRPDKLTRIAKASIRSTRRSPVSLMPAGLLNTFSRKEILDLLAWIELGVDANGN